MFDLLPVYARIKASFRAAFEVALTANCVSMKNSFPQEIL